MSTRLARYVVAAAMGAVIVASLASASSRPSQRQTQVALASFAVGVDAYMATRARAIQEVPWPPRTASFREVVAAFERRFQAVQRARADAAPGNVFSENVARMLRETIAFTLEEYDIDVKDLLAELRREVPKGAPQPRLNEEFPWGRGAAIPMVLIEALPSLPAELQYRLVDRDLVLFDVGLGLVVDILPKALPKH